MSLGQIRVGQTGVWCTGQTPDVTLCVHPDKTWAFQFTAR
jgi:hypothetical protein